jgi:peptide-methionine (S)-S-oxide reductase
MEGMKTLLMYIFALTIMNPSDQNNLQSANSVKQEKEVKYKIAVFGGGCFWCTEAIFSQLKGVKKVVSGFSGGTVPNPTYREVCTGTTGHAECTQITYDPKVISYPELLEVFWTTHDPTTLNKQGADVGTQYRSVIFYTDEEQRKQAMDYKERLEKEKIWDKPIVTEITKFDKFYSAEAYHQEYYENNPDQGYCRIVITPKVEKFRKIFADKLKTGE